MAQQRTQLKEKLWMAANAVCARDVQILWVNKEFVNTSPIPSIPIYPSNLLVPPFLFFIIDLSPFALSLPLISFPPALHFIPPALSYLTPFCLHVISHRYHYLHPSSNQPSSPDSTYLLPSFGPPPLLLSSFHQFDEGSQTQMLSVHSHFRCCPACWDPPALWLLLKNPVSVVSCVSIIMSSKAANAHYNQRQQFLIIMQLN